MHMQGTYDPLLVTLSVAVAVLASFTALNLAGRLLAADRSTRPWWLLASALSLGGGIWSMHFVGMLAHQMPMPASYDIGLTFVSLVLPFLVTGAGLYVVSRYGAGGRPLLFAGVMIGLGVAAMHYTGMAAMRMPGVVTRFDPVLVALSVTIAIAAATAAVWLAFRTSHTRERLVAAAVMGAAISGMHYTGMAAASFNEVGHANHHPADPALAPDLLAVAVFGATSTLLVLALMTAFFDRKLATLTAREAEALGRSERRYRSLIENGSDIIMITDATGLIGYESSSALRLLGFETRDMVGRPLSAFVAAEDRGALQKFLADITRGGDGPSTTELRLRCANGNWREFEATAKSEMDDTSIGGIVLSLRDITVRKELMAKLERLSESDPLTGVLNRRGFMKLAEREFERLRRTGQTVTVVMLDVDHFKRVNDTFGHAAGDLVLAMVAETCRKALRAGDVLARFGGEEFIILLIDGEPHSEQAVIARLREAVAGARVSTIKGELRVTASFGIATVEPRTVDLETAILLSDEALYEAKSAGRNCIRVRA